ncbi:NAD-dependent epimerase/dehydratase family protein [Amycolatopsis plumensis]|uniref:NAD-dependent epimerase/dehydratase family protein n=1 Tax=Amycolatopsis plumensis TaxID=236508 RepID=A0ABV5U6K2_9PSEU
MLWGTLSGGIAAPIYSAGSRLAIDRAAAVTGFIEKRAMHVFIAGATGAIGRYLTTMLRAAGHRVTGTTRTETGLRLLQGMGARGVRLDVYNAEAAKRAVAEAAPDAIIHQLTALKGGTREDNGRIRRIGTRHLVDAAKLAAVPRIITQSVAWAYGPGERPATERDTLHYEALPPRATLISGIRALENISSEIEEHIILRYGLLYGPGTWYRRGGLVDDVLNDRAHDPAALFLGDLSAANDAVSSFVHVEEAARAAADALTWPSGPVNIVDDEPAPARAWLPALAVSVGAPPPRIVSGRNAWERGADNSLARSLGWKPHYPTWRTGFFLG